MKTSILLSLAAGLFTLGLHAAEPAPEHSGLPVGEKAPAFTLADQNGKEISLPALLKKGPVALVFHRSADW